eukprot:gnl/MRDRNA2_/MRDRNA2_137034_c0_seq1.p1 gnl/MRDRNA2_/MRDRNA2_137034_c0~~gnl/MRDRNA2_/MRDRNA2_137034_c0_seq1.p1  ORF type:complete len:695 (+),score=100.56 gnl/MRDRNA2_/MRDRNA2_137034_c0_seq1:87-2171(+)
MPGQVQFSLTCEATRVGTHVRVVGSCKALGAWCPARGVLLHTNPEDFPIWRSDVQELEIEEDVHYKYVVCTTEGQAEQWEERDNRMLLPSVFKASSILIVADSFDASDFLEDKRFSHRFSSVPSVENSPWPSKKALACSPGNFSQQSSMKDFQPETGSCTPASTIFTTSTTTGGAHHSRLQSPQQSQAQLSRSQSPQQAQGRDIGRVQFMCRCEDTAVGMHVRVVGSCKGLGSWNPKFAVSLRTTATDFPMWSSDGQDLQIGDDEVAINYKYIICTADGDASQWEQGENRELLTSALRSSGYTLIVTEAFNATDLADSNRFTYRCSSLASLTGASQDNIIEVPVQVRDADAGAGFAEPERPKQLKLQSKTRIPTEVRRGVSPPRAPTRTESQEVVRLQTPPTQWQPTWLHDKLTELLGTSPSRKDAVKNNHTEEAARSKMQITSTAVDSSKVSTSMSTAAMPCRTDNSSFEKRLQSMKNIAKSLSPSRITQAFPRSLPQSMSDSRGSEDTVVPPAPPTMIMDVVPCQPQPTNVPTELKSCEKSPSTGSLHSISSQMSSATIKSHPNAKNAVVSNTLKALHSTQSLMKQANYGTTSPYLAQRSAKAGFRAATPTTVTSTPGTTPRVIGHTRPGNRGTSPVFLSQSCASLPPQSPPQRLIASSPSPQVLPRSVSFNQQTRPKSIYSSSVLQTIKKP